jgi:hypothetical protein
MFRVEWLQSALDELAAVWMQADSTLRQQITIASHQIDLRLETDPVGQSESRPEGRRVLFEYSLAVFFRLEQDEETVTVLHIWRFRKKTA